MTDAAIAPAPSSSTASPDAPQPAAKRAFSVRVLRGLNLRHAGSVMVATVDRAFFEAAAAPVDAAALAAALGGELAAGASIAPLIRPGLHGDAGPSADPLAVACRDAILTAEAWTRAMMDGDPSIDHAAIDPAPPAGSLRIEWETRDPVVSRRAAELALRFLAGRPGEPSSARRVPAGERRALAEMLAERRLSAQTAALAAAARRRGVPHAVLSPSKLRIGEGARQVVLMDGMPASTPLAAFKLARDRHHSIRRLEEAALPTPRITTASTAAAVLEATARFAAPSLLRRARITDSKAALLRGGDEAQVQAAFGRLQTDGEPLVLEELAAGREHRLLVIDGRLVAAALCRLPEVEGDGRRTVAELIAALDAEPDRDGFRLRRVRRNAALRRRLEAQGLAIDAVPAEGLRVVLAPTANPAWGASSIDVTDEVHEDNRQAAERAVRILGLQAASVHFVCPDIARSHRETGGCIVSVSPKPGLSPHLHPREGVPRDVSGALIDFVVESQGAGRVPSALIVGDTGANAMGRALAHLLSTDGRVVGLALKTGAFVGREAVELPPERLDRAAATLAADASVSAIVVATSATRLLSAGAARAGWDAALVRPAAGDEASGLAVLGMLVERSDARIVVDGQDAAAIAALRGLAPTRLVRIAATPEAAQAASRDDFGGAVASLSGPGGRRRASVRIAGRTVCSVDLAKLPIAMRKLPTEALLGAVALMAAMTVDLEAASDDAFDDE